MTQKETNKEGAQIGDGLLDKSSKGFDGTLELRDVCAEESPHAVLVNHLDEQPEARLLRESTQKSAKMAVGDDMHDKLLQGRNRGQ